MRDSIQRYIIRCKYTLGYQSIEFIPLALTYSGLFTLNIQSRPNAGGDQTGDGNVLIRETSGGGDDNFILVPNESIQYSTDGGTTWLTATYQGTAGGGIRFTAGGATYLASNTPPTPGTQYPAANANTDVCFLAGTLIDTPLGSQPIETLQPGDLVITDKGQSQVKFVSRNSYDPSLLDSLDSLAVCIRAGALGEDMPRRDLFVTGGHAILIEGNLVHASVLINGTTIVRTTIDDLSTGESIAYYNVELEEHSIVHAEGLPVESYYDIIPRHCWDNYAEYVQLYGEGDPIQEMDLPRVCFARQLPTALKQMLSISREPALASA